MTEDISFIVKDRSFEKFGMMLILGTTGDAMDVKMNFFFTFWGLHLLKKKFKPKASGMPFPMKGMGGKIFSKRLKKFGMEDPWGMIKEAVENGNMKLYPCQMTMDLMGIKREEMWDFVEDPIGAAGFLELSENAKIVSL
ncbi:MAG: DsrE/DsrF/DrsH-like family protein [Promethearchaeota archaeon]|jgi:peroxiredoxin family protein